MRRGRPGSKAAGWLRGCRFGGGCELASPFFAKRIQMSFAGSGNPPQSPPARARLCTPAGGYMRKGGIPKLLRGGCRATPWHLSTGSLRRPPSVPFHTSPLSRGALRSAGVPTIEASTTPAPWLPWRLRLGARGIWEDSVRRKGIPRVRRGVGCVGDWRFARPIRSHRGYLPVGDAVRAEPPGRASSWGA